MKKIFILICFSVLFFSCSSKKEKKEIVVWHWMTDREEVFNKLAEKYYEKTGIKIRFETYAPSDVYREKVRAAAQGKLLPDIYSPLGDLRELASFIKAGYIEDLTPYMEEGWKNIFFENILKQNYYDKDNEWGVKQGYYGVPIDVVSIEIFYNKSLFKKAGVDPNKPPETFDEFISVCRKLRSAGIQPFVSGFGEEWLINVFSQSFEWQILGKEGIVKTIKGEIKYTDPRWIKVFELFEKMRDEKIFAEGIITMINKDAERLFATEKVAMALNGSWGINVYKGMNPNLTYGVFLPPRIKDAKYPVKIWGSSSFLNVNPLSPYKKEAVEFLKWLTDDKQQIVLTKETHNIPSNKNVVNSIEDENLKNFASNIDKIFPSLPVLEHWKVVSLKCRGLQSIILRQKTAKQLAEELQKLKEEVLKEEKCL